MAQTGAQDFVDVVSKLGIGDVFCITGAGNLAIVDELSLAGKTIHYFHHEQAAAMAAIGYWRVSGTVPLVLVTTGGGTSNVVTGVLSAHLDSIPMLVVSGNESSYHIHAMEGMRAVGVQGFESVSMLSGMVKDSRRIESPESVRSEVLNSFLIATSDRMGPVHLDFPMDIQRRSSNSGAPRSHDEISLERKQNADVSIADRIASELSRAKRPLIYVGQGLTDAESLVRLCELHQIPFAVSWSAMDKFSDSHPLNVGRVGIYGRRNSNFAVQAADLIVCLGTRLSIPQVGYDRTDFGRNALKIVVDIDPTELAKHPETDYVVSLADANQVVAALLAMDAPESRADNGWRKSLSEVRELLPVFEHEAERTSLPAGCIHSLDFIEHLNGVLASDAVVVTDVGAGLLSGHYGLESNGIRTIFTSQGLGEMGFGLPAAIGAAIGAPKRQVVCLNTDGGIMFNLQELETLRNKSLPIKLVVFNNDGYSMIRISQENLFEGRLAGSDAGKDISFPNLKSLAETFGLGYARIDSIDALSEVESLLGSDHAVLMEVIMSPSQRYLPRLGTRKAADGSLSSPGLEDLDPPLPEALIARVRGILNLE